MQTFEEYVTAWDTLAAEIDALKKKLKPLTDKEMQMRKAIAEALKAAIEIKEGVNVLPLNDGRSLAYTHGIKREIEVGELENTREEFRKLNDVEVKFDELLRIKYELEKREWNKLSDAAKKVVSRMIVAKEEAPKLEIR